MSFIKGMNRITRNHLGGAKVRRAWILFIFIFWMSFLPEQDFAHAVLKAANQAAGSRLNGSPETVILTFNLKIKDGLFDVEIIN